MRSGMRRRRAAVVGALVGMLLGILLQGAELRFAATAADGAGQGHGALGGHEQPVLSARPLGLEPVAVRARTSIEAELTGLVPTPETRLAPTVAGLAAAALALAARRYRSRSERHPAPRLHRSAFAALRAPPARPAV